MADNADFDSFMSEGDSTPKKSKVSFQIDMNGEVDKGYIGEEEGEIDFSLPEDEEVALEGIEEVVIEQDPEPVSEPEPEPEQEVVEEEPVKKDKSEKKRASRAKKRIKELNDEKRAQERVIRELQRELQEINAKHDETTSTYAKVELERLVADTALLEAKLKAAAEEGDAETVTSVTRQLVEAKSHIKNLQDLSEVKPRQKEAPKQQAPTNTGLSDAAEDWMLGKEFIVDNEEYKELSLDQRKKISPVRQEMAKVARELLTEGFSNQDPLFYEEMDIRLGAKFPYYEGLANDGLDALEYNYSDESTDSQNDASGETGKPQKADKSKIVPTKGPSRSSSPNLTPKNSKGKLSEAEVKDMYSYWKNHLQKHLTWKEYMLEVKKDQERQRF